jgi:hypothetical protein
LSIPPQHTEIFLDSSFFPILVSRNLNTAMAKSKDQKKEVKKVATKTKAEKRAEKRDKKPKYD